MSKLIVTDSNGEVRTLPIETGSTLMEVLRDADYEEVQAMCGGCCSCATCHVHITKPVGDLPPIEENEAMLLEMADGYDTELSRLSCQIELDESHDGIEVQLVKEGF